MSEYSANLVVKIDTRQFKSALADVMSKSNTLASVTENSFSKMQQAYDRSATGIISTTKNAVTAVAALWAGSKVAGMFKEATLAASNYREDLAQFQHVMRNVTEESERMVDSLMSNQFGRTRQQAMQMLMGLTSTAKGMGVADKAALDLSGSIARLSVDIGSFMNKRPEDAVNAFQSALLGETMALRTYGVFLNEAILKNAAFENAKKGIVTSSEREARAYAIISEAQRQMADAIGDYSVEFGGFANQMRRLSANIETTKRLLGAGLLEPVNAVVTGFNKLVERINAVDESTAKFAGRTIALATAFGGAYAAYRTLSGVISFGNNVTKIANTLAATGTAATVAGTVATNADTAATGALTKAEASATAAIAASTAAINAETAALRLNTAVKSAASATTAKTPKQLGAVEMVRREMIYGTNREVAAAARINEKMYRDAMIGSVRDRKPLSSISTIPVIDRAAQRQTILANIEASRNARNASNFGRISYSAGNAAGTAMNAASTAASVSMLGRVGGALAKIGSSAARLLPALARIGNAARLLATPLGALAAALGGLWAGLKLVANAPAIVSVVKKSMEWLFSGGLSDAISAALDTVWGSIKTATGKLFNYTVQLIGESINGAINAHKMMWGAKNEYERGIDLDTQLAPIFESNMKKLEEDQEKRNKFLEAEAKALEKRVEIQDRIMSYQTMAVERSEEIAERELSNIESYRIAVEKEKKSAKMIKEHENNIAKLSGANLGESIISGVKKMFHNINENTYGGDFELQGKSIFNFIDNNKFIQNASKAFSEAQNIGLISIERASKLYEYNSKARSKMDDIREKMMSEMKDRESAFKRSSDILSSITETQMKNNPNALASLYRNRANESLSGIASDSTPEKSADFLEAAIENANKMRDIFDSLSERFREDSIRSTQQEAVLSSSARAAELANRVWSTQNDRQLQTLNEIRDIEKRIADEAKRMNDLNEMRYRESQDQIKVIAGHRG